MPRITLFALRRSGSHFFSNWLVSNWSGKILFEGKGSPVQSHPWSYVNRIDLMNNKRPDFDKENGLIAIEDTPLSKAVSGDWYDNGGRKQRLRTRPQRRFTRDAEGNRIEVTPEQQPKPRKRVVDTLSMVNQYITRSEKTIILVRDPINMMASVVRSGQTFTNAERTAALFSDYVKHMEDDRFLFVRYEDMLNKDYRDDLARQLGFNNKDLGVDVVPAAGTGSSFNKLDFQHAASEMEVTKRWKSMLSSKTYLHALLAPGLLQERAKVYPDTPLPAALQATLQDYVHDIGLQSLG